MRYQRLYIEKFPYSPSYSLFFYLTNQEGGENIHSTNSDIQKDYPRRLRPNGRSKCRSNHHFLPLPCILVFCSSTRFIEGTSIVPSTLFQRIHSHSIMDGIAPSTRSSNWPPRPTWLRYRLSFQRRTIVITQIYLNDINTLTAF